MDKTDCQNKICLVHCDYLNSGCMTDKNNAEYLEFDKIACCSESVKDRFLRGSGVPEEKVYTLRNFYDLDISALAKETPYNYDDSVINIVSIARLSAEKGIGRAIDAWYQSRRNDIRYYIIGDGPQKETLLKKVEGYHLGEQVLFLGEQKNPYRYMLNADYLLVPSLHEAAPMVFDEAKVLGLQIITTNTTSAAEMVSNADGIVCENSLTGIASVLYELKKCVRSRQACDDNQLQTGQLDVLVEP